MNKHRWQASSSPFCRLSWNMEVITFLVGPKKKRMTCHKALLGYYSKYFHGMLFGGFPESCKNEIELDEKPDQVAAFIK